jgi:myosin-9
MIFVAFARNIIILFAQEFIQLYQILLPRGLLSSKGDVKTFLQHSMKLNMDNCQIGKTKVSVWNESR